jgi:hypothetical protein
MISIDGFISNAKQKIDKFNQILEENNVAKINETSSPDLKLPKKAAK